MALDGAFIHFLTNELKTALVSARVSQIHQPNRDELILAVRTIGGNKKLLLSARANSPRINFTENAPENPASPPMLCMLLRKKLCGAKIADVRQPDLERIVFIDFDATNDLGDPIRLTLAVEIMGKYSNVIFIDEQGIIIDALKRVDPTMTTQRLVLPTMKYELPPAQNKLSMLDCDPSRIAKAIVEREKPEKLNKAILITVQGVSPIICREIEYLVTSGEELYTDEFNSQYMKRLDYYITKMTNAVRENSGVPYCVSEPKGKPKDISFMGITQYGSAMTVKRAESFSKLLDEFYLERDRAERMKAKGQDLLKLLSSASERTARKINTQSAELEQCRDREKLRICGDLLQANLYRIERGSPFVDVENFYDENMATLRIKLDPTKSPSQNAQKYYKDYQKAKTAQQVLTKQIELAKNELVYIDNVFDSLSRAETERELAEIRSELVSTGYIKASKNKAKELKPLPPLKFTTDDGFEILVGRNNRQNDTLTMKTASNNDIWFHTKDIPGSHTILVTNGRQPSEPAIIQAAKIAAYHSKARGGSQVPVDYTEVRNVSKPKGAKPGMVVFVNNKTVYVTPELINE
ncbi:MAG: NFACT family protein [Clostridia bacterium]|nr:NFACT family protein [Clostridia bacterium]